MPFAERVPIPLVTGARAHQGKVVQRNAQLNGEHPLTISSFRGNEACVVELLSAGTDPDDIQVNGFSSLHSACYNEHIGCARALIRHTANANLQDDRGFSALHIAVSRGNVALVQMLLRAGATVDVRTNDRSESDRLSAATPLHICCQSDQAVGVMSQLIAANADVNAADGHGWTALFHACNGGLGSAVKELLRAGADVAHVAGDGTQLRDVAPAGGNYAKSILQLLD